MVIPGLIEMHCHILPGVDDGSKDTETSVKMLRRLALQGAETVVLTPHYYSDSGLHTPLRPAAAGAHPEAEQPASWQKPRSVGR